MDGMFIYLLDVYDILSLNNLIACLEFLRGCHLASDKPASRMALLSVIYLFYFIVMP